MKTKKKNIVPRRGPEFCAIYTRKAGAHPHKNVKRKKTRQKNIKVQKILGEY